MGEHAGPDAPAAPTPSEADVGARTTTGPPEPSTPATGLGAPNAAPPATERKKRSPLAFAGQIGGVVTTIAAIVGLVFLFAPGLKPDEPATTKGASFSTISIDPMTRANYLRMLDRGFGGYTREQLRRRGVVVGFHVTIRGHKGESLPLRWGVYSADDGRQVYREKATTLTAEAATDEASSQLWTPQPSGHGAFYVLLQLFEQDGLVAINQAKSGPFFGLAGAP